MQFWILLEELTEGGFPPITSFSQAIKRSKKDSFLAKWMHEGINAKTSEFFYDLSKFWV